MIQQQERAEKFFRAIRRDAERRRKEIKQQIDSFIQQETDKVEQAEQQAADERVRYESERVQAETNSRLSKATIEVSADLAASRSAITAQVFGQVAQQLVEFTKTEEYIQWLADGLKQMQTLLGDDMTVYAAQNDVQQVEKAVKQAGVCCKVAVAKDIQVGGVRAEKGSKKVDDTLDSRLKAQEDWFYQNSGLSIAIQ